MKCVICSFTLFAGVILGASLDPKASYQPIIDAKPFGELAAQVGTSSVTQVEQQKQREEIARKFRMCGIADLPDGTRKIAFLDETSGQPVSCLLSVGETQNGFTLLSADYEREYATLKKDGIMLTLGLGKGLIEVPEVSPAASAVEGKMDVVSSRKSSETVPGDRGSQSKSVRPSFRARLLQRQAQRVEAEQTKRQALEAGATEKAKAFAERRIQIERIKQGLAPTVPIVLTVAEDAELEAAGAFIHREKNESGTVGKETPAGVDPVNEAAGEAKSAPGVQHQEVE